jgi:hypothetical protein
MMVDARATYAKALQSVKIEESPGLAMDILDRRAQRDIEFGRRITKDRGRGHFAEAVKTMRVILSVQNGKPAFKDDLGRTRNNLANALKELSKRTDGEEGDRQIDETVDLFQQAVATLEQLPDKNNILIASANLAHALGLRAARRPGLAGSADIDRARDLYTTIDTELNKDKNPRLWAIVKQNEAELLRLIGMRHTKPDEAFQALKSSFELYQKVLTVISRETAPNDWAMLCAEMGHTVVASLPLLSESNGQRLAKNAVGLFGNARPFFIAGGFGQDLERLEDAAKVVDAAAKPEAGSNSPGAGK